MDEPVNVPDIGAFGKMLGFRLGEWRDGFVRMEMEVKPEHLNRSGVLHGGIISALPDTPAAMPEPGAAGRAMSAGR